MPVRCSNYAELNSATQIYGTILAQSCELSFVIRKLTASRPWTLPLPLILDITMTGANVEGAAISLGAAVTFTGAAVRLPALALGAVAPVTHNLTVVPSAINLGRASSFAICAAAGLTNTVSDNAPEESSCLIVPLI